MSQVMSESTIHNSGNSHKIDFCEQGKTRQIPMMLRIRQVAEQLIPDCALGLDKNFDFLKLFMNIML